MTTVLALKGAYSRVAAAEYLSCSLETLRLLQEQGLIAPHYYGSKPVYKRADLDELIDALPTEKPDGAR